MNVCEWLPELLDHPDWGDYKAYEDWLYELFSKLYLEEQPEFNEKKVRHSRHRDYEGRKETFYHFICGTKLENGEVSLCEPDTNRLVRIHWPRAYIENFNCRVGCTNCDYFYWVEKRKSRYRHHFCFNNYLVVIEEEKHFFVWVTAHCIGDGQVAKKRKNYEAYKKKLEAESSIGNRL